MNPLLTKITNAVLGGGEGKLINAATNLIDKSVYSKEEKDAMKLDFARLEFEDKQAQANAALKETELILNDNANARAMQIEALKQDDKFSKHFIYYLAAFIVLAAVAFGVLLFFVDVPKENQRMVEMFADVFLFAGALTVLNFFFSSTVSSRKNSDALREVIKK
jgi:hypothetical protein